MIKRSLLLPLLLAAGGVQAQNLAAVQPSPPPEICITCHGVDGNNWVKKDDGTFGKTDGGADSPKLAGQHAEYLLKQFRDYKNGTRMDANPMMTGMITLLPDDSMMAVAKFYATQKLQPAAATGDAEMLKQGQLIWRAGLASKNVPACAACHGPAGKGLAAQYPALDGQFPEYTEAQMKAFRDGPRTNDPSRMMRDIVLRMTDPEIKAVAAFAASLR